MLAPSQINDVAQLMRSTLEKMVAVNPAGFSYGLAQFPRGSCGDASLLLATYFHLETSAASVEYLAGHRDPDSWTHAFLVVDEHIVDITGDQFPERSAVVVTKVDTWFDQWAVHTRLATTQDEFESFAEPSLTGYVEVVTHMLGSRASAERQYVRR